MLHIGVSEKKDVVYFLPPYLQMSDHPRCFFKLLLLLYKNSYYPVD